MSVLRNFGKTNPQVKPKSKGYGLTNFLKIADSYVNANTATLEGIEKWLTAWFCFTFNTTQNDSRLLDMDVEELLVLFQMHRIRNNPQEVAQELSKGDEFENWLKKEMGEEYLTHDKMIEGMEQEEQEFQRKVREKFPDRITTDFTQFNEEE